MLSSTDQNHSEIYSISLAEYEEAIQKIKALEALQQQSNQKITNLEAEIRRLQEQIRLMQYRRFGKKSEVQLGEEVFGQAPLQKVSAYTRKKGKKSQGRLVDTSILPRHSFVHDLPDEQKICGHCKNVLERIGQDISEQLEVVPLRLYVAEHIRYKYACRCCQTIEMAPKPKAPIPKALAGGSLLTEIIVNKYQHHLPLYRQSKILASYNALIPDNTLGK